SVLEDMDRYEEAIVALRQIRQMDPNFKCVNGRLLHAQRRCLDWTNLSQLTDQVVSDTLAGRLSDAPLNMLAVSDRAAVQLACARQAMADHPPAQRTPLPRRQLGVHDKIRIAYVSADLREHAVSYLMAGVFEHHDRSQFEITAISLKPPQDSPMGRRVQAAFDHFVDVSHWTDDRIVHHMRQHGYDIAVDLMGLTFGARPGIWAQGIAPIQISYLGYPGTTGAPYMDYILADTTVIPPEEQAHYSEKVVYLPDCFQANDRQRPVAERTPSRSELGLPDDAFVFCSFNNLYKIGPETFDSWIRILDQVPGSVLWLVDDQEVARRHAKQEAHVRGIDPARLIFAPRVTYADHLARLKQGDLFLDTLPFNAGTTASDALWAGLPLLTLPGEAFAARMAASLLRAVGLPELICHDRAHYEATAIDLARHPARLQALRQRLSEQRLQCPLFDTPRFTRNLEMAYRNLMLSAQA
ncbi:MAG TPA: acetylglucosamine transferase, partial [Aquabacterium sp.]|nr:acetylglucosamine transferase [Aquabacterium sp.]